MMKRRAQRGFSAVELAGLESLIKARKKGAKQG